MSDYYDLEQQVVMLFLVSQISKCHINDFYSSKHFGKKPSTSLFPTIYTSTLMMVVLKRRLFCSIILLSSIVKV